MSMPAFNYHITNKVSGLDHKGYAYAKDLKAAEKWVRELAPKFGPRTKVISVTPVKVTMPTKEPSPTKKLRNVQDRIANKGKEQPAPTKLKPRNKPKTQTKRYGGRR